MTAVAYAPPASTIPARVLAHLRSLPAGTELVSAVLADALDIDKNLGPYLKAAVDHGAIAKDVRNGLAYWSIPSGAPRVVAAPAEGDEVDQHPIVQRTVKAKQGGVALVDVQSWPGVEMSQPVSNLPPPDPDGEPAPLPCAKPSLAAVPKRIADLPAAPPIADMAHPADQLLAVAHAASAAPATLTWDNSTAVERARHAMGMPSVAAQPLAELRTAVWSDGQVTLRRGGVELVLCRDEAMALRKQLFRALRAEEGGQGASS